MINRRSSDKKAMVSAFSGLHNIPIKIEGKDGRSVRVWRRRGRLDTASSEEEAVRLRRGLFVSLLLFC